MKTACTLTEAEFSQLCIWLEQVDGLVRLLVMQHGMQDNPATATGLHLIQEKAGAVLELLDGNYKSRTITRAPESTTVQ